MKNSEVSTRDRHKAIVIGGGPIRIRTQRRYLAIGSVYEMVDTCTAEFEAQTPYYKE